MPVLRYFSSLAQPTTLAGSISNASTSITVVATTGFPTSFPYTLALDFGGVAEELVDVTAAAGTTLTITRGVDGTSAQSHSLGAVVQHVTSGRDNADYQTHQAATAAVHGVAGTLVGTSDTQTLANKTLTAPVVNGATLSGTLSGAPTLSGAAIFTGAPLFRGALATDGVANYRVSGDTNSRLLVGADGKLTWGSGSTAGDTTLSRAAAAALSSNSSVQASRTAATDVAFSGQVSTDTVERWRAYASGKQEWGPGGATARDTTLYRNAAGELKTDGAFTAAGALAGSNFTTGAWSTWTPVWTTSTGLHSPSFGSAVVTTAYARAGRTISFAMRIAFAGDTSFGAGATTSDDWRWTLPVAASATFAGTALAAGYARLGQGVNTVMAQVSISADTTTFVLATASGQQDGNALTNAGNIDALTPWTWNSTGVIGISGTYEAAS